MTESTPDIPCTAIWRLPNGLTSTEYGDGEGGPVPDDVGWESVSFQALGESCGLFDYQCLFASPVSVEGTMQVDQPHLMMRVVTAGCDAITVAGWATLEESTETSGLYLRSGPTTTIENLPGEINSVVAPRLTLARMRMMLAEQRVPVPIQRFLDGRSGDFVAALWTTPRLRTIAGDVRATPYRDGMASLYLQGKISEVLAEALAHLTEACRLSRSPG